MNDPEMDDRIACAMAAKVAVIRELTPGISTDDLRVDLWKCGFSANEINRHLDQALCVAGIPGDTWQQVGDVATGIVDGLMKKDAAE